MGEAGLIVMDFLRKISRGKGLKNRKSPTLTIKTKSNKIKRLQKEILESVLLVGVRRMEEYDGESWQKCEACRR